MSPAINIADRATSINGLATTKEKHTPNNNIPGFGTSTSSVQLNNFSDFSLKLIRKPEALKICGLSKSTLHLRINAGLMAPPISIGDRAVAFVRKEIMVVIAAQIAGKNNDEIRSLVKELVAQRQNLFSGV